MSDTWRENAIVEAIQIIADKKISQANFDKTIKGLIYNVVDSTIGKYQVKYQDSIFQAYATSSKITYEKNQQVSVLIPGNDFSRTKTIIGGINNIATNYQQIPLSSDLCNIIGKTGTIVQKDIELSSYVNQIIDLVNNGYISLQDISNYIKSGDSIILGMNVRTKLASSQSGGIYGIRFNLVFKDNLTGNEVIRTFQVNTQDVIGNPYNLPTQTPVQVLIKDIDVDNFIRVDSVYAYCNDFPEDESKSDIKDIIISNITINGATALTDDELNGYVLHIDYSQNGNILNSEIESIKLNAQLKINGKITTDNIKYYWFRQNGMIFKGSKGKYSAYAGDGWECLNYYSQSSFTPKTNGIFYFNSSEDDLINNTALAVSKVNKIRCVAVYNNREWITGDVQIINNNVNNNIIIKSSDLIQNNVNKTIYYLDNGSPTLTCQSGLQNCEYIWSVKPERGSAVQKSQTPELNIEYNQVQLAYNSQIERANNLAAASRQQYISIPNGDYQTAIQNWNNIKDEQRIDGNIYYNFPIKSISNYSIITCAVSQDGKYKGTASITLYNKTQLQGMYSLNIQNGTQVFQYDNKGNSPASSQIDKPIDILPLTFTLLDNKGKEITYNQIINNGWVKWIIPNVQTLLFSNNGIEGQPGQLDLTVTRADLPLPADKYTVYNNLPSFTYSIADRYDSKNNINYIWLNIKFKDIILDAYTDFTFPKDGDPGTNGTDFIAKIVASNSTDRIYISDKDSSIVFDDDGATVENLKFQLYNNSIKVSDEADYWSCPPATKNDIGIDSRNVITYLSNNNTWTSPRLRVVGKTIQDIQNDKPVNIIRAQYGLGRQQNNLKYFAEYPVCTEFVETGYRLKVRPKSGFKYAVYLEDGTRPDYDNTLPFEIIVEKANSDYWEKDNSIKNYEWYSIGNIEQDQLRNRGLENNKKYFKPKNNFDGSDLSSAVVVQVQNIGIIHIPIYMILNRYGHSALNGWDGNSIQLNAEGDTILAPQVGAGKKQDDNSFTGILMGDVKNNSGDTDTGLMGYNKGERTLFLDAQTGKSVFGKNNDSQIIIDPSSETAKIYSGNYNYSPGTTAGAGLEIDLTDPHIYFGSGHFTVDREGNLVAKGGGEIAGWQIGDTRLSSSDSNVYFESDETQEYAIYSHGTFTVTPDGFLTAINGKIAKWDVDEDKLSDGEVGLGQGKTIAANTFYNQSETIQPRIWSEDSFAVTNDGKIWANSAQIGPWAVEKDWFTNGNVGLGLRNFGSNNPFTNNTIAARFWAGSGSSDSNLNFAVDNEGKLYSKAGKIGGWNITNTSIYAKNNTTGTEGIRLNSNGSMNGGSGRNQQGQGGSWSINTDGSSSFINITTNYMKATNADVTGKITANSGKIGGWSIEDGNLKSGSMSITSGGSISGSNWSIDAKGNASFGRLSGTLTGNLGVGQNGSFSGGGTGTSKYNFGPSSASLGSGTQITGDTDTGETSLKEYIRLKVTNLIVSSSFSYQGRAVSIREVNYASYGGYPAPLEFTQIKIPTGFNVTTGAPIGYNTYNVCTSSHIYQQKRLFLVSDVLE